jgi:hypothetical protein
MDSRYLIGGILMIIAGFISPIAYDNPNGYLMIPIGIAILIFSIFKKKY